MAGSLHRYLQADHARLDGLLRQADAGPGVDMEAYRSFRAGLLRHIAMEERILLRDAKQRRGGDPLPVAKQLRADHAVLAALLCPTPTHEIIDMIQKILAEHNPLEEGPDGLYATCERLAGSEVEVLVARLQATPAVKEARHFDGPRIRHHIVNLLQLRKEAWEVPPSSPPHGVDRQESS